MIESTVVAGETTSHQPTLHDLVSRLSEARDMIDVNIAAGIALLELHGHRTGTSLTDALKPIRN